MANTHSVDLEADSSQYLSVADSASLSVTGDMTIEGQVKHESIGTSTLVYKTLGAGDQEGYIFYNTTSLLVLGISSDGIDTTYKWVSWSPSIATWYHIAAVYDASAGSVDFYVDGTQVGTTQTGLPTSIFDSTADFIIGGIDFDGLVDDVRIWDDIRTVTEINDNKSIELVGNEANLVGYWKLNNSLLDETSNNNDLTNNNSAVFSTDIPFDFLMVADLGTFTLTGIAASITKTWNDLVASVGSFTLTGIDAGLAKGYNIVASVGTFTLTGISASITKAWNITASVGAFTLTGIDTILTRTRKLVASTGSFVLSGIDATLKYTGFTNVIKNSATLTNISKNTATLTNTSKNTATLTNTTKNTATLTNASKNSATLTNISKS